MPLDQIQKINLKPDGTKIYRMIQRKIHDSSDPPQSLTMRDASRVIQPLFCTTHQRTPLPAIHGAIPTPLFNSAKSAFTYTAFPLDGVPKIPKDYTYLWSSYRHVQSSSNDEAILFYATLNPSYGQSTLLHKTNHPSLLIPDSEF
ncbi:unnamed protein product [Psylliodes chrysocephalus]|uniref:Uncharacterized protein n=1 Tax=Psylliodes chrysocephalus TaxID=3402493 RepID=A0A9P0D5X3_9CUCU|nr:unnamed protein product [Psylliodes chrysocephala]